MDNIAGNLKNFIVGLIVITAMVALSIFGLINWLFISDDIKTTEPIVPEIELVIKDGAVDTLYIYKNP